MQNRRERRKLLRQFGLLKPNKSNKALSGLNNIESGKELHRQNLQDMKNQEILRNKKQNPESVEAPEAFIYRGESVDYGNFQSMLINRDWENLEND
jgi:hypothetical protein